MFAQFVIFLVLIGLIVVALHLLASFHLGFFFPENNKVYVIIKGKKAVNYLCGDRNYVVKLNTSGEWHTTKLDESAIKSVLDLLFGIRFFGIWPINKIGKWAINYPKQLKSANEKTDKRHQQGNIVKALSLRHNYNVLIEGAEFRGGLQIDIEFNGDVFLSRPDMAWARVGKNLDPLGDNTDGVIKSFLLNQTLLDFLGNKLSEDKPTENIEVGKFKPTMRGEMCLKVLEMSQNIQHLTPGTVVVRISDISGYEWAMFRYLDFSALKYEKTLLVIAQLQKLVDTAIEIDIAEKGRKVAEKKAQGAAQTIEQNGIAEAKAITAVGNAKTKIFRDQLELPNGLAILTAEQRAKGIAGNTGTFVEGGANSTPLIQTSSPNLIP